MLTNTKTWCHNNVIFFLLKLVPCDETFTSLFDLKHDSQYEVVIFTFAGDQYSEDVKLEAITRKKIFVSYSTI